MTRGFSSIALVSPKTGENVGGALRAAFAYGAAQIVIGDARQTALKHGANTPKAHRHIPTILTEDVLLHVPVGAKIVVIELTDEAVSICAFDHPDRAFYVFGPEDGSVPQGIIARADHVVKVPTRGCMNLASTVCVVLYDRAKKERQATPKPAHTPTSGLARPCANPPGAGATIRKNNNNGD